MLKFKDVTVTMHGKNIITDISLDLNKGKIIAVVGPSGAGKTSFLRCAAGLIQPVKGIIRWDNAPLALLPKGFIGVVFQAFHLFPHLTLLENLCLAPKTIGSEDEKTTHEKAHDLLKEFGLRDLANVFPHQISGGQKQRTAIARTLMMDPQVVLFDEPTSALDPELVNDVGQSILKLKNSNRIIIVVTHEIRLAKRIADEIVFCDLGRVLDHVSKENFFASDPDTLISDRSRTFLENVGYN